MPTLSKNEAVSFSNVFVTENEGKTETLKRRKIPVKSKQNQQEESESTLLESLLHQKVKDF